MNIDKRKREPSHILNDINKYLSEFLVSAQVIDDQIIRMHKRLSIKTDCCFKKTTTKKKKKKRIPNH